MTGRACPTRCTRATAYKGHEPFLEPQVLNNSWESFCSMREFLLW